ncbi:MAG TPA: TIGR00730 family Rossman fold protein, partial [Solimonas sp.]|nr:TIGR00730 family Rossman fold protein [Solimonas sp.]
MKNLCVYCGSSPGRLPAYAEAARALATALVRRDIGLVYGGASLGLMGTLADAVLAEGGRVTGVIPESLFEKEIAHRGLTQMHVTASMHERKALMAQLADGFIALPGGLGTLEEILEAWTWGQLSLHAKPCGLLDVAGYYAPLCNFLDHATGEGFVRPTHRGMLLVEPEAEALLQRFEAYVAPAPTNWVERARVGAEG